MSERLQKILARAGTASRRAAEQLILEGRVKVNGRVATLGESASATDQISVDGQPIVQGPQLTLVLHKPRGVVTSANDEFGRRNVLELVPQVPGLHPVGRLDRNSEGLLLLTTDGDLTLRLTHPRYGHEKEYRVWTHVPLDAADLKALEAGVEIETPEGERVLVKAKRARSAEGGAWVVLNEGRNRQVRRMFEALGVEVVRLKRTRIGPLELGDLRLREWRELADWEVQALRSTPSVSREFASSRRNPQR